jgi:hypothetical protein
MLRVFVLLLLLANGAYFAWSRGLLQPYGFVPATNSEPQRLTQQVQPEGLQVMSAEEVKRLESAPTTAAKPGECLQAGPFNDTDAAALRSKLETTLPEGSWTLEASVEPARWIVYMGKYPNADAAAKKRTELTQRNVKFESLNNPSLEPGISLGGYETQSAADAALDALSGRGVRTARVVQERLEVHNSLLKIATAEDTLRAKLDELKPVLAGKSLRTCK